MKNKMKWKKSPITLIELMVVMAIIALIGGVVMFNLHGSLEKSKEFISQQKMERLQQGLTLQLMEQPSLVKRFSSQWKSLAKENPLLAGRGGESPIVDAYGKEFDVKLENGKVVVKQKT